MVDWDIQLPRQIVELLFANFISQYLGFHEIALDQGRIPICVLFHEYFVSRQNPY